MTWKVSCEMMWKTDPAVDAASKLPGWREFHRACGRVNLFFDRMVRDGKRYNCDAYTLVNRAPVHLAKGNGKTVLDSVVDAYRGAGRENADTEAALAVLTAVPDDDFDSLIGSDDFEGLL